MRHILCFGDSNTWGLIPGTSERYPWGTRWTSIVQENLQDARIIEEGLCGRTTVFDDAFRPYRNGAQILPLMLETYSDIDTVILMLGTNDCKSSYRASAGVIALGVEKLVQQIREVCPEVRILLVSPIVLGDHVWKAEYDPEFDQESVEVSKHLKEAYQVIARKWQVDFLAASDVAAPSARDQEHMTEEGHKQLAGKILEVLAA